MYGHWSCSPSITGNSNNTNLHLLLYVPQCHSMRMVRAPDLAWQSTIKCGQTLHAIGRYQDAIEVYMRGIPKQPDYGYALYRRALAYEAVGDREMAKRDLFRAAELEPRDGYEADVAAKLKEYGFTVHKVRSENLN